jgi:hypothetical protein
MAANRFMSSAFRASPRQPRRQISWGLHLLLVTMVRLLLLSLLKGWIDHECKEADANHQAKSNAKYDESHNFFKVSVIVGSV